MACPALLDRTQLGLLSVGSGRVIGWALDLCLEEKLSRMVGVRSGRVVCCSCRRTPATARAADIRAAGRRSAGLPEPLFPAAYRLTSPISPTAAAAPRSRIEVALPADHRRPHALIVEHGHGGS